MLERIDNRRLDYLEIYGPIASSQCLASTSFWWAVGTILKNGYISSSREFLDFDSIVSNNRKDRIDFENISNIMFNLDMLSLKLRQAEIFTIFEDDDNMRGVDIEHEVFIAYLRQDEYLIGADPLLLMKYNPHESDEDSPTFFYIQYKYTKFSLLLEQNTESDSTFVGLFRKLHGFNSTRIVEFISNEIIDASFNSMNSEEWLFM